MEWIEIAQVIERATRHTAATHGIYSRWQDISQTIFLRWRRHPDYAAKPSYQIKSMAWKSAENACRDELKRPARKREQSLEQPSRGPGQDSIPRELPDPGPTQEQVLGANESERLLIQLCDKLDPAWVRPIAKAMIAKRGDPEAAAKQLGRSKKSVQNGWSIARKPLLKLYRDAQYRG